MCPSRSWTAKRTALRCLLCAGAAGPSPLIVLTVFFAYTIPPLGAGVCSALFGQAP